MKDTILGTGRFLQLVSRDGYEFVRRTRCSGIAAVLAVTADRKLVLIEQYRVPLDCQVIELPGGVAGDLSEFEGESLETAARRELLEEAGYRAEQLEFLTDGPGSQGLSPSIITIFFAPGAVKVGPGGGDQFEQGRIRVHEVPTDQVTAWLDRKRREGVLVDLKLYAALRFLNARGGRV